MNASPISVIRPPSSMAKGRKALVVFSSTMGWYLVSFSASPMAAMAPGMSGGHAGLLMKVLAVQTVRTSSHVDVCWGDGACEVSLALARWRRSTTRSRRSFLLLTPVLLGRDGLGGTSRSSETPDDPLKFLQTILYRKSRILSCQRSVRTGRQEAHANAWLP